MDLHIDLGHIIQGALLILITVGIKYLAGLKKSVDELNIKMAQVILQLGFHDSRIKKLEEKGESNG